MITAIDSMDDTHTALLADTETGTIIRASRHDSQSAWSQKEEDWKVREVGSTISVDEVHELKLPEGDDMPDDEMEWVQEWADIVLVDLANGYNDYNDYRSLSGRSTLKLRDGDGREALATISLEE